MHSAGENVTAMLKNFSIPILYKNLQSCEAPRDCKLGRECERKIGKMWLPDKDEHAWMRGFYT